MLVEDITEPIASSYITKVYDVPYSNLYRIEVTDFNGRMLDFETRAYTKMLLIDEVDGRISIKIEAKGHDIPTPTIPYPYHMIRNGVLFALKLNKFETGHEFALNYDLFNLDIKMVVILHYEGGKGSLFISSIDEWKDNARIGHSNREVQAYLNIDVNRTLPLDYARLLFQDSTTKLWFDACNGIHYHKGFK